jgi:hypothetical protein
MNILLFVLIAGNLNLTINEACEEITYEALLYEAKHNCRNINPNKIDDNILEKLVAIEKKYNVPIKGTLLAAACYESGFNPNAVGDRKFSRDKKTPKAAGLFQMWPWWTSSKYGYNINRKDVEESSDAYIRHINKQLPKVKRRCKFKKEEKLWIAAWVTAIRSPKKKGRCFERPKHLKLLRKWYKSVNGYCEKRG